MNYKLIATTTLVIRLFLGRGYCACADPEDSISKPIMADALNGWKQDNTAAGSVRVYYTHDGGRHCKDVSPPALRHVMDQASDRDDLPAISAVDGRSAWIATIINGNVELEYTSDSGYFWKKVYTKIVADAVSISFLDDALGFLLASSSPAAGLMKKEVYETKDGGRHWSVLHTPDAQSYYTTGISFCSPQVGWITGTYHGGDSAPLYRTRDGGKSWHLQRLKIPVDFQGGYANTYPPAFHGKRKKLGCLPVKLVRHEPAPDHTSWVNYITENGGETWRLRKSPRQVAAPRDRSTDFQSVWQAVVPTALSQRNSWAGLFLLTTGFAFDAEEAK